MKDYHSPHHLLGQIKQTNWHKKLGKEEKVTVIKGLKIKQKYTYKNNAYACIYVRTLTIVYLIHLLKALGRSAQVTEQRFSEHRVEEKSL